MSTGSFGNRLAREISRNKAKSAALGVLCLVAVWFWAPLIRKYSSPKGKTPTPVAAAEASDAEPAIVVADSPATSTTPDAVNAVLDWKSLELWKQSYKSMSPCRIDELVANPFGALANRSNVATTAAPTAESAGAAGAAPGTTPSRESGLVLRGTMVSPRGAVANISGEFYSIGEVGHSTNSTDSTEAEFRILHIALDHVVIEWDGEPTRLDVVPATPPSDRRIVIRPVSRQ